MNKIKYKKFYLATTNKSKVERLAKIFRWISKDIYIEKIPESVNVEETEKTLEKNSLKKALAYSGIYRRPIISLDSGIFIDKEELDPVKIKRNALGNEKESNLTEEQISLKMQDYYRDIARKHGGTVEFYFKDVYTVLHPNGTYKQVAAVRHYDLTSIAKGKLTQFQLRTLYISKATGKRPFEQTEEDEMKELEPIIVGIKKLIDY